MLFRSDPSTQQILAKVSVGEDPHEVAVSSEQAARVVDAKTLGPISTRQAIVRYIGYFVSTFSLFLGFIWVGIDRRKQGWHDKMAGTVVIEVEEKL